MKKSVVTGVKKSVNKSVNKSVVTSSEEVCRQKCVVTGVKKSVVATTAISSLSWYTAASSEVSIPTSSAAGVGPPATALRRRISESIAGDILQPQPPPCVKEVSRTCLGAGFRAWTEGGE